MPSSATTPDARDGGGPAGPPPAAVRAEGLSKRYGGVVALADVSLEIAPGTIHAVVGENGAGKSTLMKILAGAVRPDAGRVELDGEPAELHSPQAARAHGIGIVYQELSLFAERSVLANLFANREPTRLGLVDRRAMRREAAPLLDRIGLDVDVDGVLSQLTIAERQLVELVRVLLERPRLLILDEPNSALRERETQRLFAILRQLAADGITVIYVSHRLEEVFAIADRVTVVRNGRLVWTRDRAALTIPEVIEAMLGTPEQELFPPRLEPFADRARGPLVVEGLSVRRRLEDVSFRVEAGEIVGLAGLEGAGAATVMEVLFGLRRGSAGRISFPDGRGAPASATAAARRRVSMVPADRRRQGLMLQRPISANIGHVTVGALRGRSPWLRAADLGRAAERQMQALRIKAPSATTPVHQLSGGNQQKVVLGKWLEIAPHVVLLDDPTRGIDVGAKREIFTLMRRMAADGCVVLFRSTELPELIGMCDHILVFWRRRLAGSCAGDQLTSRSLLHAINTGELASTTSEGDPA